MTPEDRYDELFHRGQEVIERLNPCEIRNEGGRVSCVSSRSIQWRNDADLDTLCCTGCQHLTPKGCSVESLRCKLWTCTHLKDHPATHELRLIEKEAEKDRSIPLYMRASKETAFSYITRRY